jgi:hypothetical protein
MDPLLDRVDALAQQLHTVQQQTRTATRRLRWWKGLASGVLVLALLSWALPVGIAQEESVTQGEKEKKGLEQRVAALESLLKHFSRQGNEVTMTGANLHLVNGLGSTDCSDEQGEIPNCPNELGNLIVGYNESRGQDGPDIRTGSHNVVVGQEHNFSSFGGVVVGLHNEISFAFASVSGGSSNIASGPASSVSGGGGSPFTVGGTGNTASGELSSVSGGSGNTASGVGSSVSGGLNRTAAGVADWVAGSLIQDE